MIKTVRYETSHVSDPEKAEKIYEETSGLEKEYGYSSYIGFECGRMKIGLVPKLEEGRKASTLLPSVEFLVNDVEKTYDELRNKEVDFIKNCMKNIGAEKASLTDPDDNILEISRVNWKKYYTVPAEGAKSRETK